jgi:2-octaprenylphenol hydroxylase
MNLQSDICIIGNGAVGKAAALGFAQAGASVTLVDAQAAPSIARAPADSDAWDLRVYALNPLAYGLLSRIKVWDALDASRVTAVDAMVVKGDDARHPGQVEFDAYGARVGALAWIVEDSNLNRALDTALQFASGVRRVQATALSLQADATGAEIRLAEGSSVRAELIVGADGAQSWVRSQADIGIDYRPYAQRAIVANFTTELPHRGVAYQWFSATDGIVALLPLAGNRVSLVWSAPDDLAQTLVAESAEALAARLGAYCAASLGALQPLGAGTVKAIPLSMIHPHAIVAPRVALVGDAAHVIHPLAGQGMNLGFADVEALLQAVAERGAHRDRGDARVLSRYARERKEDILLMHLATDGLQRLFATDFEPLRIARNIGLNVVNTLPGLKRRLIGHAMGN